MYLKIGNVVRLMSGGPLMTVSAGAKYSCEQGMHAVEELTEDSKYVYCCWFSGGGDLMASFFTIDTLEKVK